MASTFCLNILIEKLKQKNKNVFVLESWVSTPLHTINLMMLKWGFSEGFLLCIHSRACFTMTPLLMGNREKRCDVPENLIKVYEIQNSCRKARYPLGNKVQI